MRAVVAFLARHEGLSRRIEVRAIPVRYRRIVGQADIDDRRQSGQRLTLGRRQVSERQDDHQVSGLV